MGYIQFDRIDVPSGNIVPLGQLSEQLKTLKEQEITNFFVEGEPFDGYCDKVEEEELSIEEIWRLFMMSNEDLTGNVNISGEEEKSTCSLDEEICGSRAFKVPSLEEHLLSMCYDSNNDGECEILRDDGEYSGDIHGKIANDTSLRELKDSSSESLDILLNLDDDMKWTGEAVQSESLFQCPHCPSNFKVKGYLTRHLKKHAIKKEYVCPFWSANRKCHTTGEFSRRDTFRAHLRSIHFVYPVGTLRSRRNLSNGCCAACYKEFSSNNEWMKTHIEAGSCPGISRPNDSHKCVELKKEF